MRYKESKRPNIYGKCKSCTFTINDPQFKKKTSVPNGKEKNFARRTRKP